MNVVGVCQPCGARWTAERLCHCNGCHQSFAGITYYDQHLRRPSLACKEPARMGLVQNDNGVWGKPDDSGERG